MTSHELAKELLKAEDFEVTASIDISTDDCDSDRRIFTNECFGVNNLKGDGGVITILFIAEPKDNYGNTL
jgi:hypothetical protein|tara:strand:- start:4194 stop:4403 length:210 start_codon:yes stop_codon:yes gene_type:complete